MNNCIWARGVFFCFFVFRSANKSGWSCCNLNIYILVLMHSNKIIAYKV